MNTNNSSHSLRGRLFPAIGLMLMTAATVRADYQSTVLGDKPLAFYALNPAADGTSICPDLTTNGNTGEAFNIGIATGPTPYITNAASFDGQTALVDLSLIATNPAILNFYGPITMEAWVQSTNTTQGPADILGKGYDSTQNYNELVLRANGGVNYYGGTYNNTNGGASASGGLQTTNWTYLAATYDGTNWNLYVNTKLVGHGADTVGSINFSDPWRIGTGSADGTGRHFNGNISEVALYSNALTPAQVLAHYYAAELNASPNSSAPIIVTPPQSQASYVGGKVTFSVSAVSALPMTNQWYFGSTPLPGMTNTTLTLSNLQLTNAGNYRVVVGNANGTTNSAVAVLTVSTPRNLQWSANGNSGTWDNTSTNWVNLANSLQTVFNAGDAVLFDDTAGVPTTVTVSNTVVPSVVNVNASANSYTINGPGSLSGFGSFIKNGSSTLSIFTPSGYAGNVAINGGSIYAGNNCLRSISSITITNNATLDLAGGTFNNVTPITISGSGVNGQGALVNSYVDYPQELVNLIMTGDTVLGGTARWDMATGSQITGAHNLIMDWSADTSNPYGEWNSVAVGANVASITLTNGSKLGAKSMDASFLNSATVFTVQTNCQLIFWNGGWNGTIHILGGGQSYQYGAPGAFNGYSVILEDGAVWNAYGGGGNQSINVPITLNGVARFVIGDNNRTYTNVISGSGGIVTDIYNHTNIFTAANTYSGPTVIGNGPVIALTGNGSISQSSLIFFGGSSSNSVELDATGRSDSTLTLAAGQTLGGIGAVAGNLVESAGATIAPAGTNTTIGITVGANSIGTITATGNIALGGTTVLKLDGSGTNDTVGAGGNLSYSGTLSLANISGAPLAAGNTFQLFTAGGSISGNFANITPTTPGSGLVWNTSQLSSGILSVVVGSAPPVITKAALTGGKLVFSVSGNANGTFYVIASTNLLTPRSSWPVISTNSFDSSGNFSVTNGISSGTPQLFYSIKQ